MTEWNPTYVSNVKHSTVLGRIKKVAITELPVSLMEYGHLMTVIK